MIAIETPLSVNSIYSHIRRSLGKLVVLISSMLTISGMAAAQIQWTVEGQFSMPESAVYDAATDSVYVSNVNVYAKDGNGFISKLDGAGSNLQLHWLQGLDSPTGLAIQGDALFAANYDELVKIELSSGEVINRYPAPDSKPALNDVAISPAGRVFVSGSSSHTIYELTSEGLEVWMADDVLLKHANGLFVKDSVLFVGSDRLRAFNLPTKQRIKELEPTAAELQDIDGIADDGCGGLFVTLIDDTRIWRVSSTQAAQALSELKIEGIDLSRSEQMLYVPRVGNSLSKLSLPSDLCASD